MIFYFNQTCLLQTSVHFIYTQLLTATLIHSFSLHFIYIHFHLYIQTHTFIDTTHRLLIFSLSVLSSQSVQSSQLTCHTWNTHTQYTAIEIKQNTCKIKFYFKILFASDFWCVSHHFSWLDLFYRNHQSVSRQLVIFTVIHCKYHKADSMYIQCRDRKICLMAAYTHMYKYTYVHCLANQNIVYATEEEPRGPSRLSATTNIQVKVQHSSNMVQIKTAMKRGRTIVEKSHGTYTGKLKLNVNMKQRHGSNDQVVHGSRQGNAARIRMDRSSGQSKKNS